MTTRYFALAAGVVYALAGAGGLLLGDFPVDVVVNVAHLALGVWGITAYPSRSAARSYARRLAVAAALLAILALLPRTATAAMGLAPAFGAFWLHLITVALAVYYGWGRRRLTAAHERDVRRAA